MKFNLLISCMHEEDMGILTRSNVQSDVVVVNQCEHNSVEEFDFINKSGKMCHCKFINTSERGLSRSRNMAIQNSWGDVCLICDDDEYMVDECETIITEAYKENPDAGIIAFALNRKDLKKSYPTKKKHLSFKQILKTSSLQITFSRHLLCKYNIQFDEKMGSGTGNGGGEENKFLLDWRKKKAIMLYYPKIIATVNPGESQWFKGYTPKYMRDFGWSSRRAMGICIGLLYIMYFACTHMRRYRSNMSFWKCSKYLFQGFFEKR